MDSIGNLFARKRNILNSFKQDSLPLAQNEITLSEEAFNKAVLEEGLEVFTEGAINKFIQDIRKGHDAGRVTSDEIEKAKKDLSKLIKTTKIDKNGKKTTVYVKRGDEPKKEKKYKSHTGDDVAKIKDTIKRQESLIANPKSPAGAVARSKKILEQEKAKLTKMGVGGESKSEPKAKADSKQKSTEKPKEDKPERSADHEALIKVKKELAEKVKKTLSNEKDPDRRAELTTHASRLEAEHKQLSGEGEPDSTVKYDWNHEKSSGLKTTKQGDSKFTITEDNELWMTSEGITHKYKDSVKNEEDADEVIGKMLDGDDEGWSEQDDEGSTETDAEREEVGKRRDKAMKEKKLKKDVEEADKLTDLAFDQPNGGRGAKKHKAAQEAHEKVAKAYREIGSNEDAEYHEKLASKHEYRVRKDSDDPSLDDEGSDENYAEKIKSGDMEPSEAIIAMAGDEDDDDFDDRRDEAVEKLSKDLAIPKGKETKSGFKSAGRMFYDEDGDVFHDVIDVGGEEIVQADDGEGGYMWMDGPNSSKGREFTREDLEKMDKGSGKEEGELSEKEKDEAYDNLMRRNFKPSKPKKEEDKEYGVSNKTSKSGTDRRPDPSGGWYTADSKTGKRVEENAKKDTGEKPKTDEGGASKYPKAGVTMRSSGEDITGRKVRSISQRKSDDKKAGKDEYGDDGLTAEQRKQNKEAEKASKSKSKDIKKAFDTLINR